MTLRLSLAILGLGAATWLVAVRLSLAQEVPPIQEKTARFKQEMIARAAEHAALRGAKGVLPEDNSLCLLCHANFKDELLVVEHLDEGMSCAYCHGICYEHMDDETSRTKPDFLYGRAQIKPFCEICHEAHANPDKVQEFLDEWKGEVRPNGRLILAQATCTDCHGEHVITAVPVITPGG